MLDSLHYEDFAEAASVGKPLNIHLRVKNDTLTTAAINSE